MSLNKTPSDDKDTYTHLRDRICVLQFSIRVTDGKRETRNKTKFYRMIRTHMQHMHHSTNMQKQTRDI